MGLSGRLRACLLGLIVTMVALLGFAGTALAARCEAPPGTAGVDQYCETLPGAKGERGSGSGPGRVGGGPGGVGSLDRKTVGRLERAGQDGRGVLALPSSGKQTRERVEPASDPSESPLGAIGSAIESGPSSGRGFLWLLAAAGVGMVGIAWMRYRSGSGS